MTKSHFASREPAVRQMELTDGCWVDVYEGAWLAGKVRRYRGPADFLRSPRFGSIVVGPQARIVWADKPGGAALRPKQIVADIRRQFGRNPAAFRLSRV